MGRLNLIISFVSLATGRHRLGRHWRKAHGRMMMMTLAECRNNSTTRFAYQLDSADATASRWWSVACAKRIDKPRRLIFLTSHEYLHATIQTFVCIQPKDRSTARAFNSSASFIWRHFTKEPDGLRAVASDPQTKNRRENDPWQTKTNQSLNELKKTLNMCSHKENR